MPDVTVTFTDAQWTRIIAARVYKALDDLEDVDAEYLAARWKDQLTSEVQESERRAASVNDF